MTIGFVLYSFVLKVLFAKINPLFNGVRIRVDLSLSLRARACLFVCWVVPAIIAPVTYCYPFVVVKALTNK